METPELFKKTTSPIKLNSCFVLMPFRAEYDEIYQDIIKPLLEEMGYHCLRADEIYGSRAIVQDIWEHIQISGLIIADMTDRNPNVFYELGLSHACGKNVILITQSIEDVPFDLRHLRCVVYKQTLRGLIELKEKLKKTISQDLSYSKIPIDILADKFLGGFDAKRIVFSMNFSGFRGEQTSGEEDYSIVPTKSNIEEFYKKLQVSGRVASGEADKGLLKINKIFPGMYLMSLDFFNPLEKNKEGNFKLKYLLENCFGAEHEFWFYNIEVPTQCLQTIFTFPEENSVTNFRVYSKSDEREVLLDSQAKCIVKDQKTIFVWEGFDLMPPDCFVFRWTWR